MGRVVQRVGMARTAGCWSVARVWHRRPESMGYRQPEAAVRVAVRRSSVQGVCLPKLAVKLRVKLAVKQSTRHCRPKAVTRVAMRRSSAHGFAAGIHDGQGDGPRHGGGRKPAWSQTRPSGSSKGEGLVNKAQPQPVGRSTNADWVRRTKAHSVVSRSLGHH
jgi:hypothetical protein